MISAKQEKKQKQTWVCYAVVCGPGKIGCSPPGMVGRSPWRNMLPNQINFLCRSSYVERCAIWKSVDDRCTRVGRMRGVLVMEVGFFLSCGALCGRRLAFQIPAFGKPHGKLEAKWLIRDNLGKLQTFGCFLKKGTPKWMVKIMENPMNKWMIWGVFTHHFRKPPSVAIFSPEILQISTPSIKKCFKNRTKSHAGQVISGLCEASLVFSP